MASQSLYYVEGLSDTHQKSVANPSVSCSAIILAHSSKSSPSSYNDNNILPVLSTGHYQQNVTIAGSEHCENAHISAGIR